MFRLDFASPSGSRRAFRRQPSYLPRTMADLFADQEPAETAVSPPDDTAPLADRLLPRALDEVVGQEPMAGPEGAIGRLGGVGPLSPMIRWGPPGPGEPTPARESSAAVGLRFVACAVVFLGG